MAALADILRHQPKSIAYMVAFKLRGATPDIDALKLAEKCRSEMTERYMINGNLILIMPVDAGEVSKGRIDAWVVPAGVALPN